MKRALVTGGAGFIGSHLVELLLSKGYLVTALDDFSSGWKSNLPVGHENLIIRESSIMDGPLYGQYHEIYHLAAVVGVKRVLKCPIHTIMVNALGTNYVFMNARHRDTGEPSRFLLASSSEVYSEGLVEDSPRWCYATSKKAAEHFALAHTKNVTIVRLFNIVGPRQVALHGMVLPTFVGQALRGEPITVFGDGGQQRVFTCVKETVQAMWELVQEQNPNGRKIFDIGASESISMLNLAYKVKEVLNSKSDVKLVPYREAYGRNFEDIKKRMPNIKPLFQHLGWIPLKPVEKLIKEIAEWMKSSLE